MPNSPMFSFEDRFKAFLANKVLDNMEILQEKRNKEFQERVNQMLYSDIDETFTNAEFKHFMDPKNADTMLLDLTHQFIHRAIQIGHKRFMESQADNTKT